MIRRGTKEDTTPTSSGRDEEQYERIDPRTQVDPPRMLLPVDLVKPKTNPPPAQPAQPSAPPEPEKDQDAATSTQASMSPPSAASKHPRTAQTKESQDPEQLTIDSVLAPSQGQDSKPQPKTEGTQQPSSRSTGAQQSGTAQKKKTQGKDQAQAAPTKPGRRHCCHPLGAHHLEAHCGATRG